MLCSSWQDLCPQAPLPSTNLLVITASPNLSTININNINTQGLTNLSITNTGLTSVSLEGFTDLTHLDLRNNNLSSLTRPQTQNIEELYLSGNDWSCFTEEDNSLILSRFTHAMEMFWLLEKKFLQAWRDRAETFCSQSKVKATLLKERQDKEDNSEQLKPFLSFVLKATKSCPDECECHIGRNIIKRNGIFLDCSNRNLTRLPDNIPSNVISLDISHNKLTQFSFSDAMKNYIFHLNISNNKISTLEIFRPSQFFPAPYSATQPLEQFVLDVRNNKIETVPYWILVLKLRYTLLLSGNPIKCSCEETPQYMSFWEIVGEEGPECEVCQPSMRKTNLQILIVVEILALVGLGAMFYRDWRNYKNNRKLPLLADYVPHWIPAFPFSLIGSEQNKISSLMSRKLSNISSFDSFRKPAGAPAKTSSAAQLKSDHMHRELRLRLSKCVDSTL